MTREDAISMMSCYISGDLDSAAAAKIDGFVANDPELRELVDQLRQQQERTARLLCTDDPPPSLRRAWAADALPEVPIERNTQVTRAPRTGSLLAATLALAAALLLSIGLVWTLSPTPERAVGIPGAAHGHELAATGQLTALDPGDPAAIERAFDRARVPEQVRMIPDLGHIGLTTRAVYVLPGEPPGAAVEYADADQRALLCQMWMDLDIPVRDAVARDAGDRRLYGFTEGDVALVVWSEGDIVCVMSAAMPLDDLLAIVERRVTSTG